MEDKFLSENVSPDPNAKSFVLFGGNPARRDEVIRLLMPLQSISIYGTLNEEEGIKKITELKEVDLVLIGGRYSNDQRIRIRSFVKATFPNAKITEPGYDYPYSNDAIFEEVRNKLNLSI